MNTPSSDELKLLLRERLEVCVSLFMPVDRVPPGQPSGLIRLGNLLRTAEGRLLASGHRLPGVKQLLEPVSRLLEDESRWQQSGDGLAIFLAPERMRWYFLPFRVEEQVYVGTRIYVRPLLPLFGGDETFYILALSLNRARLLKGTRHSINEVNLRNAPQGLAEALRFDLPQKEIQSRAAAPVGGGRLAGMFYSSGDGADDSKERTSRYFRLVDRGLHDRLGSERVPLVLAAVDYLLPIYRGVSKYPHIVEAGIVGCPDLLSAEDLHRQASAMLEPYFEQPRQEASAQYRQLAASGRTSADVRLIVPAAYRGRTSVLFVDQRGNQWGTFEPERETVRLSLTARSGDEDLLDLAAFHTLYHGGAVYTVEPSQMPDVTPLAALFRY